MDLLKFLQVSNMSKELTSTLQVRVVAKKRNETNLTQNTGCDSDI